MFEKPINAGQQRYPLFLYTCILIVFQARRVGSVEGGSFIFWEVFFSIGDANTSAEGASI